MIGGKSSITIPMPSSVVSLNLNAPRLPRSSPTRYQKLDENCPETNGNRKDGLLRQPPAVLLFRQECDDI